MKWMVYETERGINGVAYWYRTRKEARDHVRRFRNNPFLSSFELSMMRWM